MVLNPIVRRSNALLRGSLGPNTQQRGWTENQLQVVSKVRSDFFFTKISLIIKDNFCKPEHVIHYSFNID